MKKNNKGFSLVELIIVIAIMAALVAILAPQYTKYVERSRKQADETCASEILGACKIAASDPEVSITKDTTYTFGWDGTTALKTDANVNANTALKSAVSDAVGSLPEIKSAVYNGQQYTVTITVKANGDVSFTGTWGNKPQQNP